MKRFRLTFGPGLVAFLLFVGFAPATVFNCPAGDVACLIEAIHAANEDGGVDTIVLEPGTYTLTAVDNDTDGPNGLPLISSPMTIQGAGAGATIIQRDPKLGAGPPLFRILQVRPSGSLKVEKLTIRNGALGIGVGGAGILNFAAETSLVNSAVVNNSVAASSTGGGIFNNAGTLSVSRSRLEGNRAGAGGAIHNNRTMTISQSTIVSNFADTGGGILNEFGVALITHSTIAGNSCSERGGVGLRGGAGITTLETLTVMNSTIADNVCDSAPGGGILVDSVGHLSLNNSTIAGNRAGNGLPADEGGGIHNTGRVELRNAILAGNSPFDFHGEPFPGGECSRTVTSLGNNLVGDMSGCAIPLLASDLTGDPGLDTFRDDGTPGHGHFPLVETSRAIDAGDPASCTPTDQLSRSRVDGDGDGTVVCDIGAIEFSPGPIDISELLGLEPLITAFDDTPVLGGLAGTFSIKATFANKSALPIHDPVFRVTELSGGNLLLNADGGPGQAGAGLTPDVGPDAVLSPDESFTTEFVIGLQSRVRFTFIVDVLGVPGPP